MMPLIPINVDEATIVSLVLHDLVLGYFETLAILEVALAH